MKLLQVFVVVSVAVAAATGKTTKNGSVDFELAPLASAVGIDAQGAVLDPKYCVGKDDENVYHPTDCTKYISCTNQRSIEMDCAKCDQNLPHTCAPNGRLVYTKSGEYSDIKYGHCDGADKVPCNGTGEPPAQSSPIPPPSTESPPNNPPTTEEPPQEGEDCQPELCVVSGDCDIIRYCNETTKKIVVELCGEGLFYDPELTPEQGGNCNRFDDLSDAVKQKYWNTECLECKWWGEDCANEYHYRAPNSTSVAGVKLTCPTGLVFDKRTHVCRNCGEAEKADGTLCC